MPNALSMDFQFSLEETAKFAPSIELSKQFIYSYWRAGRLIQSRPERRTLRPRTMFVSAFEGDLGADGGSVLLPCVCLTRLTAKYRLRRCRSILLPSSQTNIYR